MREYVSHRIVGPFNHLEVLEANNHRRVVSPGDDVSEEHQEIKDSAAKFHTAEVIEAYEEHIANSNT